MSSYGRLDWDVPSIEHIPDIKYIDHAKVVEEVAEWLKSEGYTIDRKLSEFKINNNPFYIYGFAKRSEDQKPFFNQTDNTPLIFAVRSEKESDNYTFKYNNHYYELYYCKGGINTTSGKIQFNDITNENKECIKEDELKEIIKNG